MYAGEPRHIELFTCKMYLRPDGRCTPIYLSAEKKRFQSMAKVATFLNLANVPKPSVRKLTSKTLSHLEIKALGKLASYLEERGGEV